MKLNVVRAQVLEGATAALLEAALSDFLAATGAYSGENPEREFVAIEYHVTSLTGGDSFSALVLYTE